MRERGLFFSFEGSEGCGKSTQIQRLRARLEAAGREITMVREPGGTALGEKVRSLLQHDAAGEGMCAEAELLLFGASRAQLVRDVIRPALERGNIVLADRFADSTLVYQGAGRGLNEDTIRAVTGIATGGLMPDLTLLLDVDVETGMGRLESQGRDRDRMERSGDAFFERVRAGYLRLAAADPDRVFVLDARSTPDEIESAIAAEVERRWHGVFS